MWVLSVHGVAWSGSSRIRYGADRVERVDERTDHVGVPALERVDLHVGATLVAGLVGRLDVQHEEVAVGERRRGTRRACAA